MKYLKKIILSLILIMSLSLFLTGCADQIQLGTTLNINSDFSGSRVMALEITKSSFESNSSKSIDEVTKLINSSCPSEMSSEFKAGSDFYQYIFTIDFKNQDEYIQKVSEILGEEVNVQISNPNNVFAAGIVLSESFSSEQLLKWLRDTLSENNITTQSNIFSENGSTVNVCGKVYQIQQPQISVSDITFTKVNSINVYTDILASDSVNRTINIIIPKEEWLSKKEAIQKYTSANTTKQCTYKIEESDSDVSVIFSLNDVTYKELEKNIKVILDSDSYTIKRAAAVQTVADEKDTEGQVKTADFEYRKPFNIKTGYIEYLDLSSYAGSSNGKIELNYYINKTDKGEQTIQYLLNGEYTTVISSESQNSKYRSVVIDEYGANYIQVSSETDYVAEKIDIGTALGRNSNLTKTVRLEISTQPNDSDKETILKNLKDYAKEAAKIEYEKAGESHAVITITITGNIKDVNATINNLFGSGNEIKYFKEKGFFQFNKTGVFIESIDLDNFITCDNSNINYEVNTNFGEKIDKTISGDEYSNEELGRHSYKVSTVGGSLDVKFTTASFNYILLIFISAIINFIVAAIILLGKRRGFTSMKEVVNSQDWNNLKGFSASSILYLKNKLSRIKNCAIVKSSINNMKSIEIKEDAANRGGSKNKIHLGMKIFILLAEVCFFLPLCVISCDSSSITLNGAKLSFGVDLMGEHIDGNLICILLMLFPIIMAALLLVKKLQKGFLSEIAIGLMSAINIGILLVLHARITENVKEYMCRVDFKFGYYLATLSYLLLLLGSGLLIWAKVKENTVAKSIQNTDNGETNVDKCDDCSIR